jgi:hypothetical protein
MVRKFHLIALLVLGLAAVPSLAHADDDDAPAPTPILGADTPPLGVKKILIDVPPGTEVGTWGTGLFCHGSQPVIWQQDDHFNVTDSVFSTALRDELKAKGYKLAEGSDDMFGEPGEGSEAALQMGGRIEDVKLELCYTILNGVIRKVKGTATVRVTWEVYSTLDRKVIYKTSTTGATEDDEKVSDVAVLLSHAFKTAADGLLADRAFHDALTAKAGAAQEVPQQEALAIPRIKDSRSPLSKHVNDVRSSVVTVFSGTGTGSGVIISADGYVLTDAHVVAGDKFVKVKLVTGRQILGEVLRKDVKRDVALIKVEESGLPALPIRETEPDVGEDVYALGASLGKYESTLTRGIVSAYRDTREGKLIQSDVKVLPGNSGGPLLDAYGNVIGLCESGAVIPGMPGEVPSGVNFFNPILDSLKALGVQLR